MSKPTINILETRMARIGHPEVPALVLGMVQGRIMDRNLCIWSLSDADLRQIVDECWKTFDALRPQARSARG